MLRPRILTLIVLALALYLIWYGASGLAAATASVTW